MSTRKRGTAGLLVPCPLDHPMGERVTKEFLDRNSVATHEKGALPVQRELFFPLGKIVIAVQSLPTRTARRSVPTSEALRDRRLIGLHPGFPLQTPPRPRTSGGRAISPKAPRRQSRTARRSVPTSEALRDRRLFGLHSGFLPQTPPHPRTSGVGRFLRKRHVDRLSTDRW